MKMILLLIAIFATTFKGFSQNCGTPTNFPNTLPTYTYQSGELYDEAPICVRVFFHIVRNSAGTTGFNAANIQGRVNYLNQVFSLHNVVIVNQGQDFIDNDTYGLEFNDGEFNALTQTNNVSNAINIYLLPVEVSGSPAYAGRASAIPGNSLVVAFSFITTSTLPHELGHCLNLFHTHHQVEQGGCDETGSGKTCSSCGDYVCDTPIDPVLSCGGNVDISTCNYTRGGGLTPFTNNIMSYSCRPCRTAFTGGQGLRMRISLNFDPLLSNFRTVDCINITGPNPVCTSGNYTINNLPAGSTVSWTLSNNNYAALATAGNSCTVTKQANSNGSVTLICNMITPNGNLIATKDLTIGTGNTMGYTQKVISCVNNKPYFTGAVTQVPFVTNYAWYAKDESNPNNPFVLKQSENSNTADFPLGNNRGNRYYTIRVIATATCGTTQTVDADGYIFAPLCGGSGLRATANPNPTSGFITLNFEEDIDKSLPVIISVYDLSGNLEFQRKFTQIDKKLNLNLTGVKKGNHFLKISNGGNETSINIVIN